MAAITVVERLRERWALRRFLRGGSGRVTHHAAVDRALPRMGQPRIDLQDKDALWKVLDEPQSKSTASG